MPAGRAFALMYGSDRLNRIERWNQEAEMPDAVPLIALAGIDRDMHETISHVNAALVAAGISPDHPQAESPLVERAELLWILRPYGDVSDLHFVWHELILLVLDSRRLDNKHGLVVNEGSIPSSTVPQ
jgi:hypothetical protein